MNPNNLDPLTLIVTAWITNASKEDLVYATDMMRLRVREILAAEGLPLPEEASMGYDERESAADDEDMDTTQARALINRIRQL